MARRSNRTLRPLDYVILRAAFELQAQRRNEFHGYLLARHMEPQAGIGHTTLYRGLEGLERMGLLESRWEAKEEANRAGRPPCCYYRLTGMAETAYRVWARLTTKQSPRGCVATAAGPGWIA